LSTFEVPVLRIDDVYDHPNADRLSIIRVRGYEAISAKLDDGSHRFAKGELIAYVPEGAVVTERLLKERGFWNAEKGVGMLAGSKGDRVKAIKLRGVLSQGLVWKAVTEVPAGAVFGHGDAEDERTGSFRLKTAAEGDNLADFFGIVKYEEPIPTSMSGKVISVAEARFDYDIENLKNCPDLFQDGEHVVITEKLHGTFCRISYVPRLAARDDLFGDGRIAIASKGLGARGLVFANVEENLTGGNVYVRALAAGELERFRDIADRHYFGRTVHLLGEVFGRGVQDLSYGEQSPTFRAFDVYVEGQGFLDEDDKVQFFADVGLTRVPVLGCGPFTRAAMDALVDGQTTLNDGANIREGIVITATGSQEKRDAGLGRTFRPILKHVSEAYLTRKGGTELQ
jgi:RNA ligase (TIGR02306 family)